MKESFNPLGKDLFGNPIEQSTHGRAPPMQSRFTFPPFSVLDARGGEWQERKRAWLALGIQSEVGRLGVRPYSNAAGQDTRPGRTDGEPYAGGDAWNSGAKRKVALTSGSGLGYEFPEYAARMNPKPYIECRTDGLLGIPSTDMYRRPGEPASASAGSGTSIFDPVLCELMYRWFCPHAGAVLDPFAGGSVRGIVAGLLGLAYVGCELSDPQVGSNREQAAAICPDARIWWHTGDSRELVPWLGTSPPEQGGKPAVGYDFIFSCPPYFNLEVYSDDARDLSTMSWITFCEAYRQIIAAACALLKPDAFACFVVGDVREKSGPYRNFTGETTAAFKSAGLELYNDAVLVTAVGSLPIRVGKQFSAGRKLGKSHQNVLVYVKGDWKAAASACGSID